MPKNKVTIQSIADALGVSVSTVSRVMNGVGKKYRISTKTRDIILKKAKELDYTPNKIAKSLRLQKTFTIGLIIPDISNPWFSKIAMKIEEESRKKKYNVFLCNTNGDINIEKESLELMENWHVDGVVIVPIGLEYEHLLKSYKNGMPLVFVDRFFEGIDIPYVSTNDLEGAYEANEYLIKNGHRNIACIQGLIGTSQNTQRVKGYKKALEDNNLPYRSDLIVGYDFGFQNGYDQAKKIIEQIDKTKVTAIFSTGNQITLGILKALKEKNIRIPEDLSLISFDENNYSELLYTPISTVSHVDEKIGDKAIELLFNQINKTIADNNYILTPTHLIKRDSVKQL
ncbi:LacI family transcriptional regulator [Aquimarina sp. MAR_2010_214]|uniref:LacI family DNA-binding transcriptional regulator n=1 Tax=Aquimarina sp. MAR_2010_214 TaxID=1250026 RepID=UPI000C70F495|nr:LacI family DNA-binding transcriptional regulator [Aquimarina sp. MAR_2010_214]PKV51137.1 LacI family transcriptional regulator [Aquimarina sp. MAR_2010_214]